MTRALGVTRCPGCDHLFTLDTRPTVTFEADGYGQVRQAMAGHQMVRKQITWHVACREDFQAWSDASRLKAEAEQEQALRKIAEAAGLDYSTLKEKSDG